MSPKKKSRKRKKNDDNPKAVKKGIEEIEEVLASLEGVIEEVSRLLAINPEVGFQAEGVEATLLAPINIRVAEAVPIVEVEIAPLILMEVEVVEAIQ